MMLYIALAVVALPFYAYLLFKCAAAGWAAGTIQYMSYWYKGRKEMEDGRDA